MESKSVGGNVDVMARIEALMEEERTTIELRRRESTAASEPGLKSILTKLTELHAQSYAQLESYLKELRSSNEITQQINEMFI
jgi:rubrerythrin